MKVINKKYLPTFMVLITIFVNITGTFAAYEGNETQPYETNTLNESTYFSASDDVFEAQDFPAATFRETPAFQATTNVLEETESLYEVEQFDPYYLLYKYGDGSIPRVRTNRVLTFNANGGNVNPTSEIVPAGTVLSWRLPTPTRANHNFLGWFTAPLGGTQVMSQTVMPNANTTLWARWQAFGANAVTVTLEPNPGALDWALRTRRVNLNTAVGHLPSPVWANHVFLGWFDTASSVGGTQFTQNTIVRGQTNLHGRWRGTITLNANGGTVFVPTVNATIGGLVGTLPIATRSGHTFVGWFNTPAASGGYQVRASSILDGSGMVWARWQVNEVTITFNPNGGMVNTTSRTIPSGTAIGTLPEPSRDGYDFVGWFTTSAATGGTQVNSNIILNNNITLWARWQVNQVTVSFNANGGTVSPTSRAITSGTSLGSLMPTPTRTGHTFVGWFTTSAATGGTQISSNVILNNDITLWARWQVNQVTITFDPNGGTVNTASRTIPSGTAIGVLPEPSRDGFDFVGWFLTPNPPGVHNFDFANESDNFPFEQTELEDNRGRSLLGDIIISTLFDRDTTLFAVWRENQITATFNANGGTISSPWSNTRRIAPGNPLGQLPAITRPGHALVGWFDTMAPTGGSRISENTLAPTNNTTYWARWNDPNRHLWLWWPTNFISIRSINAGAWTPYLEAGMNSWNASNTPVHFFVDHTSNNTINISTDFWADGLGINHIFPDHTGTQVVRSEIELFVHNINTYVMLSNGSFQDVVQSVVAHELGHTIGLRDGYRQNFPLGGFLNASLMNQDRSRNIVTAPTAFDVTSVNMLYSFEQ